jgi:hypothetical protein
MNRVAKWQNYSMLKYTVDNTIMKQPLHRQAQLIFKKQFVVYENIINTLRGCLHVRFPIQIPIRFGVQFAA